MNLLSTATIQSLRPWSFPASLQNILVSSTLAYTKHNNIFNVYNFIICIILVICVHTGGNLVNTYYDYKLGIDKSDTSDDRALVDHNLTTKQVLHMIYISYTMAIISILYLSISTYYTHGVSNVLTVLLLSSIGIILSYMYTAPPFALKYHALGDIVIFLTSATLLY